MSEATATRRSAGRWRRRAAPLLAALMLAACTATLSAVPTSTDGVPTRSPEPSPSAAAEPSPSASDPGPSAAPDPSPAPSPSPSGLPGADPSPDPSSDPRPSADPSPSPGPSPVPAPDPSASPVAAPTSSAGPSSMVELQFESAAGPSLERSAGPGAGALEPVVAAHPSDPAILALAYARARPATEASYGIVAAVRVSRDGGRTWRETKRHPWDRSGRGPSLHSAVAFGPGPSGEGRLYWAGTTSGGGDGVRIAIAWTDDLGSSWSRLHVVRDTPAWGGGFPDITVDCDPDSPGYGNVYVVYAYPAAKGRGAGIHLLASGDHGRSWRGVDIARATADPASKASWRFGSRVRAAPDGAVYVSTYQADLRTWDAGDPFDRGGAANVTRVGFAVTRLTFDRTTRRFSAGPTTMAATLARNGYTVSRQVAPGTRAHTYLDPIWSHGLDVDPVTGRVFLAIGTVSARPATGQTRGSVAVGSSDDGGRHWTWQTLAQAPAVDGLRQSSFRPTLAVSGSLVFVGLHTIDEVALKGAWAADATIGTAYAVSPDGGRTFTTPAPVTPARWRASALERTYNGPGLRDRATSTADGRVAYAYGDARTAPSKTARATGQRQVYVALLSLGAPATPLPWQTRRAS